MKKFRNLVAAGLGTWLAAASMPAAAQPVNILFVGNSYTHTRYRPGLNYDAGAGNAAGSGLVHDLLCPTSPCAGVEGVSRVTPTTANTYGATLQAQLTFLQNNPSLQYTEVGPFGGVAGIFLQLTKEAGLSYNVSLVAVSSATLKGYANNSGNEANDLALIANAKFSQIVLQDQTFDPLPTKITVNGQSVMTRGNPSGFQAGVNGLVNAIDTADQTASVPFATITLAETPALAAYGYTSTNPNLPIFGSSTPAQQSGNAEYAPYVGAANPIAQMGSDLHNAYVNTAATYNAANPSQSHVNVALDGDAWVTAINLGYAQQNPYLVTEPVGQVDLWDSDPLLACCTVPIGYHPSSYGDYLNGLMLFGQITGINPLRVLSEFQTGGVSVAKALDIPPVTATRLATAAELTLVAGGPVQTAPPQVCYELYWKACTAAGATP